MFVLAAGPALSGNDLWTANIVNSTSMLTYIGTWLIFHYFLYQLSLAQNRQFQGEEEEEEEGVT